MISIDSAVGMVLADVPEDSLRWTETLKIRLREAREYKGISQPRAAHLIGIDSNTLWRWENGYVKKIPIFGLRGLAWVYGVSVGWLIGQDDALSPDESELVQMYRMASSDFRRAIVAALREGVGSPSLTRN